jgi:hypothetical protein
VEDGSGTVDASEEGVAELEQLAQAGTRTVRDLDGDASDVWRCQATDAFKPLKTSNLAQYWPEFTEGTLGRSGSVGWPPAGLSWRLQTDLGC